MTMHHIHRIPTDPKPECRPWQPAIVTIPEWMQRRKAEVARLGVPVEVPARPTGSRLREKRWTMLYGAPHATERDDSHA